MSNPVGTGPYYLKEWIRSSKIVLLANPDYRGFVWDFHADVNNAPVEEGLRYNAPGMDHALSVFLEDVEARGLSEKILLVVCGEIGRTPRVNTTAGRDHWPGAMSVIFAGGGLRMGQTIGATDARAEYPRERAVGPQDVLATMYHVLGIDYRHEFYDGGRRPIPILNEGKPIEELL